MAARSLVGSLLCAWLVAACAATDAGQAAGATCDQFASSRSIEQARSLAVGEELEVVLCSNPSTGFSWGDAGIADPGVLGLVDRSFAGPGAATPAVVGAAGNDVLVVRGLASGTTTLSLAYGQPWAGGTAGAWSYVLTVTVR